MLDTTTKKRIDDCRDILVGKLPDPKAQIEQITIGLIYKFMDDMDKEAIELGGKAKFFSGNYKKYSWKNLFDAKVTAAEMLGLYSEAIADMDKNPNIPQLFRNIFKNAFLPYRDPETLKLFLKTINEFKYTHSEKLGDAFEYLLSVMGSQGDAGQFRTPRHIIDFIVAAVDPNKNDKILDPACGTAGFLISAFKHIKEKNKKGLTPDERKKLIQNFVGYDISPDMVRLSLVNLYLHGFNDPHIWEYDTLTSEERWDETFDVILANPPFMSPKGGIRPHKRFSIQANRSEVLFVDYIAEHINAATGRAGIIVPEGIIFQSATAYKALRKMLVDKNYLYAVVSLPAGVFNPYSGVKTSILLMDKALAKKTDKILFIKIENDGFDLGAQRREIDKNDLPEALNILQQYKKCLNHDLPDYPDFDDFIKNYNEKKIPNKNNQSNPLISLIKVQTIAAKGDYNLSIDRYRENGNAKQSHFEMVRLGDVLETTSGGTPLRNKLEYYEGGTIPWLKSGEIAQGLIFNSEEKITEVGLKNSSAKIFPVNTVLVALYGATVGQVGLLKIEAATNQAVCGIMPNEKIIPEYLYLVLKTQRDYLIGLSSGGAQPNISQGIIRDLEIPLPPLEIQHQIVSKIENYQAIINGAKQVVENYKPQIEIKDDWEMVELGSVCEVNPKKSEVKELPDDTLVSFVPMADINENRMDFVPKEKRKLSEVVGGYTYFKDNDVLVAKVTPCFENGKAGIANNLENGIGFGSSEFYVLKCNGNVLPVWIYLQVTSDKFRKVGTEQMTGTGGLQRVPKDFVNTFQIPLPSLSEQQAIVKQIEQEQEIINSNKKLIAIYEQKIKDEINKLWKKEPKEYAMNEQITMAAEE